MIEVEIKALVKDVDLFLLQLNKRGAIHVNDESQLNHYFTGILDHCRLFDEVFPLVEQSSRAMELWDALKIDGKKSFRTRKTETGVLLIIKIAANATSCENGTARTEFEIQLPVSIERLDAILQKAGLQIQAKWSRSRQTFRLEDLTICLDKNAGYGYLAEFELMLPDSEKEKVPSALKALGKDLESFGLQELKQDRLERMFKYYNSNWSEYYGTNKIFEVA